MKALIFTGNHGMQLVERERPKAHGETVVVKVTSSAICGTDIELLLPSKEPLSTIPGHEVSGTVVEVDRATRFRPGDDVMVNCHVTCGTCEHCRNGDLIFCPELKAIGFELDGGNAEYLVIPESSLYPLPPGISEEASVLIADALGTSYSAVKKAQIQPGDFVGVFGVGPLGQLAVMAASSFGGRVVAVDLNDKRLEKSKGFGAEFQVNPNEKDPIAAIRAVTGNRGLDKAIQCTPSSAAMITALDALRVRGSMVQVGVCTRAEINPMDQIVFRETRIIGSRNFNVNDYEELADFVRRNPKVTEVITHRYPLDQAESAFKMAMSGDALKVLLKP